MVGTIESIEQSSREREGIEKKHTHTHLLYRSYLHTVLLYCTPVHNRVFVCVYTRSMCGHNGGGGFYESPPPYSFDLETPCRAVCVYVCDVCLCVQKSSSWNTNERITNLLFQELAAPFARLQSRVFNIITNLIILLQRINVNP